ncbi:MAG TPA: HAD family hydrolase [Nocardia sp.]|uniref:HAD family hydrolase n=1 Tax=Nocardia TaxID=1817 RepID=UPI002458F1EC|nr:MULTISPECIES: HAD family hydrolase [Nocardia]HLS78996.1 HAD family hydrolase [Nocardia sp.]
MSAAPSGRTVLWDLDGTLVGVRGRAVKTLMPVLAARSFRSTGPHRFLRELPGVLRAVRANDTELTNTDYMVGLLAERFALTPAEAEQRLRHLAEVEFPRLRSCFPPLPIAVDTVRALRAAGDTQVVATNPLWPASTAITRLRWGGHDPSAFAFITSGETMRRSKPRVEFYHELLERLSLRPGECVMVGNDAANDAPAALAGIPMFLLGAGHAVPAACARTGRVTTGHWPRLREWLGIEEKSCTSS